MRAKKIVANDTEMVGSGSPFDAVGPLLPKQFIGPRQQIHRRDLASSKPAADRPHSRVPSIAALSSE